MIGCSLLLSFLFCSCVPGTSPYWWRSLIIIFSCTLVSSAGYPSFWTLSFSSVSLFIWSLFVLVLLASLCFSRVYFDWLLFLLCVLLFINIFNTPGLSFLICVPSFQNFEYYNFSWGKSFSPVKLFSLLLVLLVSIQSSAKFHFMFRFMLQNFYPPPPSGSREVLGFFKHFFYIFFQTTKSNHQRPTVSLLFPNPFRKLDTFLLKPYSNLIKDLKETLDILLLSRYTISHIFISLCYVMKSRLSFLSSLSLSS